MVLKVVFRIDRFRRYVKLASCMTCPKIIDTALGEEALLQIQWTPALNSSPSIVWILFQMVFNGPQENYHIAQVH